MSEVTDSPASSSGNITLRRTRGSVILSLGPGTPCGTYAPIADALDKNGLTVIPDMSSDGACLLHVSGYKRPEEVTQILSRQGIAPQEITSDPSASQKLKTLDRMKNRSLSLSGYTYLVGDISLFISGMMSKHPKEAAAGLAYASGGLVSAIYGNPSESRQIRNVGVRLGDFLNLQGADIPKDSTLQEVMSKRRGGLAEKTEGFLYRHPSEIHNLIYAVGGTQLAASGFSKKTKGDSAWWKDMAAGALVTGGGLVGGLVPEKHGDDNQSTGILHWIKEKPLRLAGYLYTLNNGFLIASAWGDYKTSPKNKSYIFKFATAASFLVANAFMSMTSRSHSANGGNEDQRHLVEGMAAEVIAAQPEAERGKLTKQVAGFLSQQPETKEDKALLEASIARKVAALGDSPWQRQPGVAASVTTDTLKVQPELPAKSWADRTAPDIGNLTPAQTGMSI